jgi:hypothetical protein
MNTACHYAIMRFMPFAETGEFGNVGIVLYAPKANYFGFKLLSKRAARITHFFDRLEAPLFRDCMRSAEVELLRIQDLINRANAAVTSQASDSVTAMHLWEEVIKPCESMVRFSPARMVLAKAPQDTVDDLFEFYVEHSFATKEYNEKLLERNVRNCLAEIGVKKSFQAVSIGNEEYKAVFPLVSLVNDKPNKIIKPLGLDYLQPEKIIDHGGQWRIKIEALKKRKLLPASVLFVINGDLNDNYSTLGRARQDVIGGLREQGVKVSAENDRQAIISFARS